MKAFHIIASLVALLVGGVLSLAGALWIWSGTPASLAFALAQIPHYLPAGQTLEVKDVHGSLREGGRIGWLRWQQGALRVEVQEISTAWLLKPLIHGELRLNRLSAHHVLIDDRRAPSAPLPPVQLSLPLRVDTPFSIATMVWAGPPALQMQEISGHYNFNSIEHSIQADKVQIASGIYQVKSRLQAHAPMALTVQLQGVVPTKIPSSPQSVTVQAHADLTGTLAGQDATLQLKAQLQPQWSTTTAHTTKPAQPMQAHVIAQIMPWQHQPIISATAQWQALNLAALWPQAPRTLLTGTALIAPKNKGWQADLQWTNTQSGPWDQQRLPLESLNTQVSYENGQWTVASLTATGAGGRITGQGKLTTIAASHWQGMATVVDINPAKLDSRWASTALRGALVAEQTAAGIVFNVNLQPSARQASVALAGLRLKNIQAQGAWQAPLLTLKSLNLQTDEAQLSGGLIFNTVSQATSGQLELRGPGITGTLEGEMASTRGQGRLTLRVTEAALAARWAGRWPGAPEFLGQTTLGGNAELTGRWQGGWQQHGQTLQVEAHLRAARLDVQGSDPAIAPTWRIKDVQADLSGTLNALSLSARSHVETGSRRFSLQLQGLGGRVNDSSWQARLNTAQFTAQDSLQSGAWRLQLNDSVTLQWKQDAHGNGLDISAGTAQLSGPLPGTSLLSWLPTRWSQPSHGASPKSQWRSQGRLQGLPLSWLEFAGQTQIAHLGLRGDLVFGGLWDIQGGEDLRLQATLERTGGDLQLQTEEAGILRSGVRDARLTLTSEGPQLQASLTWNSERAGQVQASFSTRLQRQNGTWTWPANAPLSGTVQAQLPPVGAWSILAPPGWRLRGSLNAQAVVSGTRAVPQWRGTLQAHDLAVRSVVDGIDFSKGRLLASLEGQRLSIDEFTLQGAGGAGHLSVQGSVDWLPASGAATTVASRLRMNLTAQAKALSLSTRADRRLAVSGTLTAQLAQARLSIAGMLKADQALFILPEDSAPQLGDDVKVKTRGIQPEPALRIASNTTKGIRITPEIAIGLDLGPDFQIRGRGLASRLSGRLDLRTSSESHLTPRLSGDIRTVGGTYKAYGQQLNIEEGLLRFTGPYGNPVLSILAIRPNLQQRVGVQISGTALSPVVRLYAEPELPDAEKLAWLVLGRSAAQGGAESAVLQQAALALLGGNGKSLPGSLAEALGLDEVSIRSNATSNADGSTTAGATVTLGKRFSRDFYIAYERSLAGTLGTFYIFYDLSRRFTLRAQTGEQSAIDLIFTLRYE